MNPLPAAAPRPEPEIRVGGLVPMSAADFPGYLAAVVFLQGCPWRCRYCHNPHLIPASAPTALGWSEVYDFLTRRRRLLDAVVFTGGEPALQRDLPEAMRQVRELGFKVALHTGGGYPAHLKELLPHCDWVGMDVKAPFGDYERITGVPGSGDKARLSAQQLIASGIEHEFRTTVHPLLLNENDILNIARDLATMGAKRFVLQEFRATGCADSELCDAGADRTLTGEAMEQRLRTVIPDFTVRRA